MNIRSSNFNLKHIAESGQCFRMNPIGNNRYSLIAFGKYIELTQIEEDSVEITCSEEDYKLVWKDYFDMDYNYNQIITSLSQGQDEFLKNAACFGRGLRILKQEIFEILISFIISQRKNIPAIKNCIERLCIKYGEQKLCKECGDRVYYTFPPPEKLAGADVKELRETGLGYRDEYILKTSRSVLRDEVNLTFLKHLGREEAVKQLLTLSGVGIKVANCVSLYGLHHIDAFPVDVWIDRVLKNIYCNQFNLELYHGYAGIVQQYMFYYIRNFKQKSPGGEIIQ